MLDASLILKLLMCSMCVGKLKFARFWECMYMYVYSIATYTIKLEIFI